MYTARNKENSLYTLTLSMHNTPQQKTNKVKHLGIQVDEKLKGNTQIQFICKKIAQYCVLFCNIRHSTNQS